MSIGGIEIGLGAAAGVTSIVAKALTTGFNTAPSLDVNNSPWTPPQWSKQKAKYSIVVQDTGGPTGESTVNGVLTLTANSQSAFAGKMFVFDAMLHADHDISATATEKPLQTGVNISDNVKLNPRFINLEVAMSDAMASYQSGMWTGNASKSVSAFQQMVALQVNRAFLTLNTRLQTYQNCVLLNIRAIDDAKHFNGASMMLTFKQLFLSVVASQYNSARSQTTGSTQLGTTQAGSIDTNILAGYTQLAPAPGQPSVPGSGLISSNPIGGGS